MIGDALGIQTRGCRMEGTDESTVLWVLAQAKEFK